MLLALSVVLFSNRVCYAAFESCDTLSVCCVCEILSRDVQKNYLVQVYETYRLWQNVSAVTFVICNIRISPPMLLQA